MCGLHVPPMMPPMTSQSNYSVRRTFIELDECSVAPLKRCNTWDGSLSWGSRSDVDDAESESTTFGSGRDDLLSDTDAELSSDAVAEEQPLNGTTSADTMQTAAPQFCKFGGECYSKRCRFVHPTADGLARSGVPRNCVGLRPCKYGAMCFNQNKEHRQRFRHSEDVPAFP